MNYIYIRSVLFLSLLQSCNAEDLSCSGDSIFSRLSAYNPLNSTSTEFSTLDFHGQSLKTLQDYLKGLAAYVTVAMDPNLLDNQIPYGTVVCIAKLNEKYRKNIRFEIRDTAPDLDGLGYNRASICVGTAEDLTDESVNSLVNMRLPSGTIKDDEETDELDDKNLIADVEMVNYPGLREDYSAQKRDQYGASSYYYPPYYYYPAPKTTTTEKPYYPYPPYPQYPPYGQYPPYPPPPPPYHDYYQTTTTTAKPYPYYPPANAYYYYPYYKNPTNNMYGYSNNYYNVSYDPPTPNYKPMPVSNTYAPPNYGSYPSYYMPPTSNNYNPPPPSSYGSNSNSRPY